MRDEYVFPAVFNYADDGISITFPDLPGCLPCAHSENEAVKNAREALELYLWCMERDGENIPEPAPFDAASLAVNEKLRVVDVFMPPVRIEMENQNRVVKKTLALPEWLYDAAKRRGGDFSQLVQASLVRYLELAE